MSSPTTTIESGGAKRSILTAAAFVAALGAVAAIYFFFLRDILTLESLAGAKDSLAEFTRNNVVWVFLAAVLAYLVVTAVLLPTVSWLSITISYAFGAAYGVFTGAVIASASVFFGALLGIPFAFWVVRNIAGDRLRNSFGPAIDRIARGVEDDALFYLIAMRLIPVLPYVVVNAAPALVRVKLSTHMLASAFGLIPGIFAYAYLGASLTTVLQPTGIQVSWQILAAFAGLGLLSLIPIVLKRLFPNLISSKEA